MKVRTLISALTCIAAIAFVSPQVQSQDKPKYGGKLIVGISADAQKFDPHFKAGKESDIVQEGIFERLVRLDAGGNVLPDLTESWEVVDATTYDFKLRRDVKFHDGSDFNADVAKWNFDFALDPKNATAVAGQLAMIESVTVTGPYIVRFKLKYPFSAFPIRLASWVAKIKSKMAYEKFGKERSIKNPVGTGPFLFKEWKPDQYIRLVRNPNYWNKKLPYLDEIEYRPIPDASVKLVNLLTGKVHLVDNVPPHELANLEKNKDLVVAKSEGWNQELLWFNVRRPPFDNPKLRLAVAKSINKAAMVKALFFGTAIPATGGGLPPSSWAFKSDLNASTYDLEGAKRLMAESGVASGLKATVIVGTASPIFKREAEMIQQFVKPLGIDLKVEVLETGAWWDRVLGEGFKWDAALEDFGLNPDPDEYYSLHIPCGDTYNLSGICDKEIEKAFNEGRGKTDQEQRKQAYFKVQEQLDQKVPLVFLAHRQNLKVHWNYVKGFSPRGNGLMRIHEVWLDK